MTDSGKPWRIKRKVDFSLKHMRWLADMLDTLFPPEPEAETPVEAMVEAPLDKTPFPYRKARSVAEPSKFRDFVNEEIQFDWVSEIQSEGLPYKQQESLDLEIPVLDPRLAGQDVSLRHFSQATSRYMIRLQGQYRNFTIEDFGAAVGITKSYYYKILNCERRPSRDTAIAMAVCLGLDVKETQDYLLLLGEMLNESVKRDYIILHCIAHRYSVDQTDLVLNHFHASPLMDE